MQTGGMMCATDARELCELRIEEDKISAGAALAEFRQLTGWSLRNCEHIYRKFQSMVQSRAQQSPAEEANGN